MQTVVWGNGAMARVVFSYARNAIGIAGFTVDDGFCDSPTFCGLTLAPFSAVEAAFPPGRFAMIMAIGFTEMNQLRHDRAQQARARGYDFARYIHPSVALHDDVCIGDGAVVLDHVSIHPGCTIGGGTFISSNVNIGHDCHIGEECWINAGVSIAGGCRIGARCVLGVNAAVAHGIELGDRSFVGANTLITRCTEAGSAYISPGGERFPFGSQALLRFSARGPLTGKCRTPDSFTGS